MTKSVILACACLSAVVLTVQEAEARRRGGGRFVGDLISRGAGETAGRTIGRKNYTPDVLTISQLADCLKRAGDLDDDSEKIEARRTKLNRLKSDIDDKERDLEYQRISVNTRNQLAIERFNNEIDRYNTLVNSAKAQNEKFNLSVRIHNDEANSYNVVCAKKYYADDLEAAKKSAGF